MQATARHVSEQASQVDATSGTPQSTPFIQLAAAIRDAHVLEVIETFKELAELAIKIQRVDTIRPELSPDLRDLTYVKSALHIVKERLLM